MEITERNILPAGFDRETVTRHVVNITAGTHSNTEREEEV